MRRSHLLRHFVVTAIVIPALWLVSGCGGGSGMAGGNGGGGGSTNGVASVTVSPATAAIDTTATLTMTPTVTCTGTCGQNVNVTMDASSAGTLSATTNVASGTAVVFTPSASYAGGTVHVTFTSTTDSTKSATTTITISQASAITGVSVSANPTTVASGGSTTCTATVSGTGSFNSGVNWSATNGTISGGGNSVTLVVNSGVSSASCKATSVQDPTQSGSATVTVTTTGGAVTLQSVTVQGQDSIFCMNGCPKSTVYFVLQGKNIKPGYTVTTSGWTPDFVLGASNFNSDGTVTTPPIFFGANQVWGLWIPFKVVPNDGSAASNTVLFEYQMPINTASWVSSNEVVAGYGTSTLWQNNGGTWSAVTTKLPGPPIAAYTDPSTKKLYFVAGWNTYDDQGNLLNGAQGSSDGPVSSTDVAGNMACQTQSVETFFSIFTINVTNGTSVKVPTGQYPYGCSGTVINGTIYFFGISVGGTPTVWAADSTGKSLGSAILTGVTSVSDIAANNVIEGGWEIAAFKSGPGLGKFGVLSTYDKLLLIYTFDAKTGAISQTPVSVPLACKKPEVLNTVDADGSFRVTCNNTANGGYSSFISVDASGNATVLTGTTPTFAQGALADGSNTYVFYAVNPPVTVPVGGGGPPAPLVSSH